MTVGRWLTPIAAAALLAACAPPSGPGAFRSCAEAAEAGAAPIHRGDPGYSSELDRDGDGVACES